MTVSEYTRSLIDQGLPKKVIYDMVVEFKAKNPESEVKKNDSTETQDPNGESENNTGSESGDGSLQPQGIITNKEDAAKARPGQEYHNHGWEYKYELDPNDPKTPIYYTRKQGSDNWIKVTRDSDEESFVTIGSDFGHNDFDKDKYLKQKKQKEEYERKLKEQKEQKKKAIKQYIADDKKGIKGVFGGKDGDIFGNFGFGEGKEFSWSALAKDWNDLEIIEGISRAGGEGVEAALDTIGERADFILEPIAGALNATGILDLSDYEDDSWDGINFDGAINDIITNYALDEGATPGAYGDEYDFAEETGDRIESGILSIAAGISAFPKLLSDTKKQIYKSFNLSPEEMAWAENMLIMTSGNSFAGFITRNDVVEAGEKAYEKFSEKAENLNLTLMDFGDISMSGQIGEAFVKYKKDENGEPVLDENGEKIVLEQSTKDRIGAFLTGSARITSSAIGSLPSVAQSMIPYVGIASIVAGEAARTNMENAKDGRPLDWARLGHSYVTGASEGLLELVTKKIGSNMFKNLRGGPKEAIAKNLRQYGTQVLKEFGAEGLSETGTLLINQAADYIYKDEVDNFLPAFGEVMDTFLIGGVMGGGMSSVGAGAGLIRNTIARKNIKNNLKGTDFKDLSSMFDGDIETVVPDTTVDQTAETTETTETAETAETTETSEPTVEAEATDVGTDATTSETIEQTSEKTVRSNKDVTDNARSNRSSKTSRGTQVDGSLNSDPDLKSKKQIKKQKVLTADQKADNAFNILQNPQTEKFLNTELKRKVESGQMTTDKANQIKANFKSKKGAAERISDLGYTGETRGNIIDLLSEKQDLQSTVKRVNDSGLTKAESERINEIDAELAAIPRSDQQQEAIDQQVEKDIAFTEKFRNIGTRDGEFENAVGENKAVQTFDSTTKFNEFLEANNIKGDPNTDAVILSNGQILINKQHMREAGAIGAGRHELLHKILKAEFSGPNGNKLKDEFLNILQETDPNGYKLLMDKVDSLYTKEEIENAPDEYITQYASLLAEGKIPLETFVEKPSLVERLGNFFSKIFSNAANANPEGVDVKPSDISFKDGQDLYDFVRDYVKESESGQLSERAEQLAEKGRNVEGRQTESRSTVLESINNLIPTNLKTKAEFDAWVQSNKGGKIIADALRPGGVIHNYIRSRGTRQESDQMLDDVLFRVYNFNPEAKRKDGTTVGPEAFGEKIFADTAWAKTTARTKLFEEGQRRKQEKSIDSSEVTQLTTDQKQTSRKEKETAKAQTPRATTKFTPDFVGKLGINTEGRTEAEINEDVQKQFDEAIAKDLEAMGPITTFGQTKDIGPALSALMEKATGMPAKVFMEKNKNIAKKDATSGALTAIKQYLDNNAQRDFTNLPDAFAPNTGKATFIPENVKKALYKKNDKDQFVLDKSKTLKDYKNLLGDMEKPVYRASEAQTIKGLVALSLRNRIFEQAVPNPLDRAVTGVKFSKTKTPTLVNSVKGQNQLNDVGQARDFNAVAKILGIKGKIGINRGNVLAKRTQMIESIETHGITSITFEAGRFANFGRAYKTIKGVKYYTLIDGSIVKDGSKEYKKAVKEETFMPKGGSLYYSVKQKAYQDALALAKANDGAMPKLPKAKRVAANKANTPAGKQQAKDNMKVLEYFATQLETAVSNGMPMELASLFITSSYQATTGLIKISYPINSASVNPQYAKIGKNNQVAGKEKFREEHSPPASVSGASLMFGIQNGQVKEIIQNIKDNAFQTLLSKADDVKLDEAGLDATLPDGVNISTPNSGIRRFAAAGINLNTITDFDTGKTFAEIMNVGVTLKSSKSNPNIVYAQNALINEQITDDLDGKTTQDRIKAYEPIAELEFKSSKSNINTFGDKLNAEMTIAEQLTMLGTYDKAARKARDINAPKKGISVFDFDDTLARTKEKVIVNNSDGTSIEISAAQFAEQAAQLEAEGAKFDFSNFNNVGKGTQKGPLADLALKRQGKFGSKDIFVLTARPQISAQGIKTFLDGIGLNIPLSNITGLENGTPEAKANWVIGKAAEGYNDFYFADDAYKNVQAVQEVLSQVDVDSEVQVAKFSKTKTFDKVFNNIIEDSTGIGAEKTYSKARAQTVGAKKGRFSFFTTPSAEDFLGLMYKLLGKGKKGEAALQFIKDNLIDPYNKAEILVTKAKIQAAKDFKALKSNLKSLPKSLSKETGIGGFTFSHAVRVAAWTRQGMTIPGLSKRDVVELNKFVESDAELNTFVDELLKIQKGKPYPAPNKEWLGGNITSDIINDINKVNRKQYLQEWQENVDIIFSEKNMNKLEAAFGPRYVEALRDQLRRMKSGSNRPVGGSRVVNQVLDWLNNSVGAIMFLNTRSAVLQTLSAVNFIGVGNNGIINAAKAFANQKQFWKDFMTLMNSPYLVERRNGLKINVSESEIADAVAESSNKAKSVLGLLLNKGFILTRFADSFAIAVGGSAFYRNQLQSYLDQGMDQKLAEQKAFDDFYQIAETNQQSSNPSKISQQQASGAGRVILAFANTPMQYARIIKRSAQDLKNGRGDWKKHVGTIAFYGIIQNVVFNALQNALFALGFGEDEEEDKKKEEKMGRIANGMVDSLLSGLGIQGKAVLSLKNSLITLAKEMDSESPKFVKAVYDLFDFSPPLDSKFRKLRVAANTFTWDRKNIIEKGFSLDNPAYLATAQVISGLTNIPLDRAIQKMNNIRGIMSEQSERWQKVALALGWSTWDVGLGYYGGFDPVKPLTEQEQYDLDVSNMKKETTAKQQKQMLLDLGLSKSEIKKLKYEEDRVKKIIALQKKKKDAK